LDITNPLSVIHFNVYDTLLSTGNLSWQYLHHQLLNKIKKIKMQKLIIVISLCFLSIATFAQGNNKMISGIVKDSKNEVIAGATVRLFKAADSTIVKNAITNGSGKFGFNNIADGTYQLVITSIWTKTV
jgi:uncharacterized surface anchored protein